jgi:Predicted phosphatases
MDCVETGAPFFGKHRRIHRVLTTLGVRPNRAIYVGDQLSDADAARAAGVRFGAVSWGYGAPEALARHHPDIMFSNIEDIGLLTIHQH